MSGALVPRGEDAAHGHEPSHGDHSTQSGIIRAMRFTSRLAVRGDVLAIAEVMTAAIVELQRGFLEDEQIEASHAVMGIDTQLIDDGTYFVVEAGSDLAGCGGWSRR